MKVSATLALFAAAACVASAADVMVHGAQVQMAPSAGVDLRVGTHSSQNRATALINKNAVSMDSNMLVTRSNVILSQNDRMALGKKIEEALTKPVMKADAETEDPDATAVLTKDVMRVVSGDKTDAALMTKASAVVAAKGDQSTLMQRINDFIDTAMSTRKAKAKKTEEEEEQEQAIQSNTPRGVTVLVGTKDIQRQPSAVVNKNLAMSDNQVMISRSAISPTQNDRVMLRGSKVADMVAPASVVTTTGKDDSESEEEEGEKKKKDEELEKKKKKSTKKKTT